MTKMMPFRSGGEERSPNIMHFDKLVKTDKMGIAIGFSLE